MTSISKTNSQKKAFTVVELLVVVALVSLFVVIVFRLFSSTGSSQKRATDDLHMQTRVLNAQNRIIRMVREGKDFILPELGEQSAALIFIDSESNVQALYQLKDDSKKGPDGNNLYKLMHYKTEIENFDVNNPTYDPQMSSVVADHVHEILFRPSSANSINVFASFATENRSFQVLFEAGLMNSGDFE